MPAGAREAAILPSALGWRPIVRLILDITKTRAGRYEGRLTVPGAGAHHDFAGILELLAILEEQLGSEDAPRSPT
jgi:hypothetical protein